MACAGVNLAFMLIDSMQLRRSAEPVPQVCVCVLMSCVCGLKLCV